MTQCHILIPVVKPKMVLSLLDGKRDIEYDDTEQGHSWLKVICRGEGEGIQFAGRDYSDDRYRGYGKSTDAGLVDVVVTDAPQDRSHADISFETIDKT